MVRGCWSWWWPRRSSARRCRRSLLRSTIDPDWDYASPGPAKCVEIGNVYLHKGALEGALSRFQEAVKDDPHYAPAYLGLGRVYERMKQKQKALDAYERYLDELPSAKQANDARDAQRAIARLRSQLGLNPKGSDKGP